MLLHEEIRNKSTLNEGYRKKYSFKNNYKNTVRIGRKLNLAQKVNV